MKKWKAILKNGEVIEENIEKPNWTPELAKNITHLELDNNGQIIKLPPNMEEYVQAKTGSADILSHKCQLESRYIGFIKNGIKVIVRVNEATNNVSIEVV